MKRVRDILFYSLSIISLFEGLLFSQTIFRDDEIIRIKDLQPTFYFVVDQRTFSCVGQYGGHNYNGTEKKDIILVSLDRTERPFTVCTRFYYGLAMEGTGILYEQDGKQFTVNWFGQQGRRGPYKYLVLDKCKYGIGSQGENLCLLPLHTFATDPKAHKIGDIIYLPKADGLTLPDGSKHNGIFIVLDTGSAFIGIGPRRVDVFTGLQDQDDNVFVNNGIVNMQRLEAYKLYGAKKEKAYEYLKNKYPDLFMQRDVPVDGR